MMINPLVARFADNAAVLVSADAHSRFESCMSSGWAAFQAYEARDAASVEPARMDSTDGGEDDFWFASTDWRAAYRPYVVADGVLQIPVKGVLLHDFGYAFGGYMTGYNYIWRAFERGMADANVKGIALIIDSPGGEVAGNFDLVDKMFAMRGTKPVQAFASESAYSAAYSIASVADSITVTRTGGVGSVGVVTSHVDVSTRMDKDGMKVTFIYAGKHKVDGNPYEALSDEVKGRIQARIDELYSVFVSTVARNRSQLSEEEVRASEALTFTASQSLSNKFADNIGALDDSLADFSASLNPTEGDENMADFSQADLDNAVATASLSARAEGVSEGTKIGATAERSRIVAILGSDASKERPVAAMAAALETDLTVEQAAAFIGKLPVEGKVAEAAAATQNGFEAAMNASEQPNLGANVVANVSADADTGAADIALAQAFGLIGVKSPK